MQDKYEALAELLKDEETAKTVLGSSPEEAQINLKEKGFEFTVEELTKLAEDAVSAENSGGEMDEDLLDNVSGGVIIGATIAIGAGLAALWGWSKRRK